jgi:hypothetical protein
LFNGTLPFGNIGIIEDLKWELLKHIQRWFGACNFWTQGCEKIRELLNLLYARGFGACHLWEQCLQIWMNCPPNFFVCKVIWCLQSLSTIFKRIWDSPNILYLMFKYIRCLIKYTQCMRYLSLVFEIEQSYVFIATLFFLFFGHLISHCC